MSETLAIPLNEAAARIGVGRTTFYKLVSAGKIGVIRLGTKTIVPTSVSVVR